MFVDIENFKSVLAIENLLIPYKRGRLAPDKKSYLSKEPITPDICWEVLRSTNAPRSIENMLSCIADLPPSEQAQFKDVVLATFDNREQPDKKPFNIVLLGKKLAAASGYEAELAEAQKPRDGYFLFSAPHVDRSFVTFKNSFSDVDFSAYDKVIFLSSEKIEFAENVKFPRILEFPNSSDVSFLYLEDEVYKGCDFSGVETIFFKDGAKVDLGEAENLPPNIDFSRCSDVNLSKCDLSNQTNLSFKGEAIIYLIYAKNLPPNLDFSRCSEVYLSGCDLSGQPNLSFKDGAIVDLGEAKNLPHDIDFSHCSEVDLECCDLSNQSNLSFKDGAIVSLADAKNLPANLDFSHCDKVDLGYCDLSNQPNLSFKDGAKVYLGLVRNLPANLDFSRCAEVLLNDCNLALVKELVFKNREQMKESGAEIPDDWKGKLVFVDEQPQNDLNLAMPLKTKGGR